MQGMVSGVMMVAAFAMVAAAAGLVAVRLYWMSRRALPGGAGPGAPDGASGASGASSVSEAPDA
jgi:hypothetical protein